ncbi:hypothetical protein HYT00_03615 [Candidatus Giovannonibacteria bacterium]|nr:hypothetical protein [Candidatus Giovannonibacteria bacterium]
MIKKILTSTLLMPALALSLYASPVLASYEHHWSSSDNDVNVSNTNSAAVKNYVDVSASTGGNTADAGNGGSAGNGGTVSNASDDNTGGNGGNAGSGGTGGIITTGDAGAAAIVANDVNSNRTRVVADCGCRGDNDVNVGNNNRAYVKNDVDARAKTGRNQANGGDAGSAGNGGTVSNASDDNTGGNGGNAGSGGTGGDILTGSAGSLATVFNTVNSNVTRIRR